MSLHLPDIRDQYDLVIANGENAARGKGLDRRSYRLLREAGVDLVSLGNHAWDHKEVYELLEREPVVRALNYPPGTPGRGWWRLSAGG
ncbi:YmdB family metallophosphoesterase, partial [Acinetobacter baumannii]